MLATSRIALVEVPRAVRLANSAPDVQQEAARLLASCLLVDIGDALLRAAAKLSSRTIRTLDAIHLASALRIDPDEFLGYDQRLVAAARERGLVVAHPGATP